VPNQTLQALADKHGIDLATIEKWWGQARAIYGKDYKAVMGTVMKRIRTRGTARANVIAGK
jgi:transposase-like protein